MDINKLSGKIIGETIEVCPPLQAQARLRQVGTGWEGA